jgi:hypothetical protein
MAEELQRIVPPYGDIVLASTPTLDRVSNQLYQEQQQRLALKMKENQALDAGIQKELGKVRSVDTPEIIQSYNNYKQLKKQLLFDKNLQKDPVAYNQLQQAANQAYQDIFSKANKSAEVKEMAKTMTTDRFKNPDNYADDYGQRVSTLMATPISALQQHPEYGDLTNWDQYRYQGSNTDFSKLLNTAMGMPKQVYTSSKVLDGGLQTELTPYTFTNTPAQVYENLLGSFATHKAGRDAAYQWDNIPTEQVQATVEKYKQIPASKWQHMGLPSPQELGNFTDNKADNYAKYLAMNYAINNEPKQGTPVFRENKKAVMDAQEAKERRMLALRHANAKELIQLRKDIDPSDTEMNNTWVDSFWKARISEAKSDNPVPFRDPNNPVGLKMGYEIEIDPNMARAFERNGRQPDRMFVTADNKIWPIYYKYDQEVDKEGNPIKGTAVVKTNARGEPVYDEDDSKPMSLDQAYLALGYRGQTKKQLEETMQSVLKGGQPKQESKKAKYPLPAGKHRTVKQGGFTYTWNEQTGEYE